MGKRFLTLDIGAANIALAEYEGGKDGALTLVKYGTAALGAPLDAGNTGTILSPAIMEIVREKGIKPGAVAISLSGQMVFPRFTAIPYAGGDDKFEQMIRMDIEQNTPFALDQMVCDRQVLGETATGDKSVMIVSAKIDQVESITAAVSSVGFSPMLVDVAPLALTNALSYNHPDESESCRIMLDIGAKTTSLVITEGDKIYNRSIPVAGNNITNEIAKAFGCTTAEAEAIKLEKAYVSAGGVTEDEDPELDRVSKICRTVMTRIHAEISRSINFYRSQQGGGVPVKLYLTGGSALLPQVDLFFSESLQIEVEFFNPFDNITLAPSVDTTALESDAALLGPTAGLAVHLAGKAPLAIDLLPPSIVGERAEVAKIPFVAAGVVGIVIALVCGLVAVNHHGTVLQAQVDAVKARADKLSGFDRKIKSAQEKCAVSVAKADEIKSLADRRGGLVARLNAVRGALSDGMWIEKWEDGRVTIRGWKDKLDALVEQDAARNGGKRQTASEIVERKLKANPAVVAESVKIAAMTPVGKDDRVEQFITEITFK